MYRLNSRLDPGSILSSFTLSGQFLVVLETKTMELTLTHSIVIDLYKVSGLCQLFKEAKQ